MGLWSITLLFQSTVSSSFLFLLLFSTTSFWWGSQDFRSAFPYIAHKFFKFGLVFATWNSSGIVVNLVMSYMLVLTVHQFHLLLF